MTVMGEKTFEEQMAEREAALAARLRTRTGKKEQAQNLLMHGIGNVLGYWMETDVLVLDALGGEGSKGAAEFDEILKREADRVAKLFGFEEAWGN